MKPRVRVTESSNCAQNSSAVLVACVGSCPSNSGWPLPGPKKPELSSMQSESSSASGFSLASM